MRFFFVFWGCVYSRAAGGGGCEAAWLLWAASALEAARERQPRRRVACRWGILPLRRERAVGHAVCQNLDADQAFTILAAAAAMSNVDAEECLVRMNAGDTDLRMGNIEVLLPVLVAAAASGNVIAAQCLESACFPK